MFVDGQIVTRPTRDRLTTGPRGVRKIVPEKCSWGYTGFCTAFGSTYYLIDMNGMVVQQWPVTRCQIGEILPNGNLMADSYGQGMEEITPLGEVVWKREDHTHHDFHVVDEDHIVTVRGKRPVQPCVPGIYEEDVAVDGSRTDFIIGLNRKTNEVEWEFDLSKHVQELHDLAGLPLPIPYRLMDSNGNLTKRGQEDWGHVNTVEVLPDTPIGRKDERFRAGNVLISYRALDIIAVCDIEKDKIVWAWGLGVLDGQHQPMMTDEGTILIFDNGTARGYSVALEIDPTTNTEVWRYEDRAEFYSPYRSGVQRLPNGNTLIAECDAGRLIEVTPEKEIVWEYLNPFFDQRAGSQGLHIYRATRYTDDQVAAVFAQRADEKVTAVSDSDRKKLATRAEALALYREGTRG